LFSTTDRARYGKRVVLAANEQLEQQGKTAKLTLSEESRPFRGGLYVQSGKIETNCTFSTLLRLQRQQMAGEVAKVLFD
jgi:V/A-type H+-transporting ATPase subunit E